MKLPVGYKELEYIESRSGQYINTGINGADDLTISCKVEVLSDSTSTAAIFGSRTNVSSGDSFTLWIFNGAFRSDYGSEALPIPITAIGVHEILKRASVTMVDGKQYTHGITNFSNKIPVTIGVVNESDGVDTRFAELRIFHFSISGDHSSELVPSEDSNGVVGLYDITNGSFNSGTGGFIAGPEVTYPPGKPASLNVSLDGQTVILSWNGAENPESYNIYRNGGLIGSSETESYVDSDVPYGSYTYEVSTVNRYGESEKISASVKIVEPIANNADVEKRTLVYLLDRNYQPYDVIDSFQSLIWAVRYTKCGDFELYIPATAKTVSRFHEGDYAMIEESDRLMVIEDINLETDTENGDYLIVSGRSLESILDRRIIWGMTVLTGNFQNGIKTLLTRNVISPSIVNRAIPNFAFKESDDPRITGLTIEAQYFGENLYEEIEKLCAEKNLGFKILPTDNGGFEFSLYFGEDRSYAQDKNPWVVFAPNYENLQSSNYLYSKKDLRNATLVGGQGEGWSRDTVDVSSDDSSGLDRRETFTDASGITNDTTDIENDTELTEEEKQEIIAAMTAEYQNQLRQKGSEELAKTKITETFDGEIDASIQYVYGRDFYLGDIVQIENAYGMTASTRVSEVVISHDTTGKTVIPTFTVDEKKDGE